MGLTNLIRKLVIGAIVFRLGSCYGELKTERRYNLLEESYIGRQVELDSRILENYKGGGSDERIWRKKY